MIVYAAFSRSGAAWASLIAEALGGRVFAPARYVRAGHTPIDGTVEEWAASWFDKEKAQALVFICAAGIAVRAVAPLLTNKMSDPAVVVMDDVGRYVVPLLSGHVGGANALARKLAALTGGQAAVTTASDGRCLVAADEWAVRNDCTIENPEALKHVSAAMIEAADGFAPKVGVAVTEGLCPPPWPVTLWLRPRNLVLGVGCKKGVDEQVMADCIDDFIAGAGMSPLALKSVATIDLKSEEPAIIAFCRKQGISFNIYSAVELQTAAGAFTASARVLAVTGVDNVCERAASLAAGDGGTMIRGKTLYPGIALALARAPRTEWEQLRCR